MKQILEFCEGAPISRYRPGEVLLKEAESSGKLYILIDGEVEILKGDAQINCVSQPGSVFGEISALLGIPHMASVKAVGETKAYAIDDGSEFLKNHPEISFYLSRMLAERLNCVTSYLMDIKRQFEGQDNHLEMVDEVLESLVHQQSVDFSPGSDRDPDIKL